MRAIAKRRIAGALAVAQPHLLVLSQREFHGCFACAFVAAVAHRLMAAETA